MKELLIMKIEFEPGKVCGRVQIKWSDKELCTSDITVTKDDVADFLEHKANHYEENCTISISDRKVMVCQLHGLIELLRGE